MRSRLVVLPLDDRSTLTIRQFFDPVERVELVQLLYNFDEGTSAIGFPPIDVSALAATADAAGLLDTHYKEEAVKLEPVLDSLRLPGDPTESLEELAARLERTDPRAATAVEDALKAAKRRSRKRPRTDEWYRDLCEYRSEHGVRATGVKYGGSDSQVQRWLREAVRRGFTYEGMRSARGGSEDSLPIRSHVDRSAPDGS